MKKHYPIRLALAISCGFLAAFEIPNGWILNDPKNQYRADIEAGSGRDGKNAVTIQSKRKNKDGICTLLQKSELGKYQGKRMKMTGWMKSENVSGFAYFWLRIDKDCPQKGLRFDNMKDKIVKGTTAWTQYSLVVDVPAKATSATYGVLLKNSGQIWFNSIHFELAQESDKTTGIVLDNDSVSKIPTEPMNSNFE